MSRQATRFSRSRHIEEPVVNLTPLIDVVFVILIMFILVAPLLELDRVELADSAAAAQDAPISVQESSPVSIHVQRDNTITFNRQPVTLEKLPTLLKQAKERYPDARLQLFHDRRGQFGTYQTIKNAAEAAGFQQIDVVLKPA